MTQLSFALVDNDGEKELLREVEGGLEELKLEMEEESVKETAKKGFHVLEEAGRLFHIAIPSVAIQFSMLIIFPMAASFVGITRGTEELAGLSLGSLVGNLTTLSVMVGALSAADTLMPRAYGSENYVELGRLAIRSVVVCVFLLIPPIVPLCTIMDWALVQLGQDPVASSLAASWIRIYLIGAPANLLFRVIQRFLVAQHQPWPPVYASVLSAFVLNPILLFTLIPAMGLNGSALATAITQWAMLFLLLLYLHYRPVYHPDSWPGFKLSFFKEALQPGPLARFYHLSMGGVLSLSEWWYWEVNW
jgi:MATE family multidrug resistance protein